MAATKAAVSLRRFTEADDVAWNRLAAGARNPHFFFRRDYLGYHGRRFEDHSLMLWRSNRLLGAFPTHRCGDRLVSHAGLSFGGLIMSAEARRADIAGFFDLLGDHMRGECLSALEYRRAPLPYWRSAGEEDLWELAARGARRIAVNVGAALAPSGPMAIGRTCRNELNRARASGFEFRNDSVDACWPIIMETLKRRHGATAVHSPEEIRLLADRFSENIRAYSVFSGLERLASVVAFISPSVTKLQYFGWRPEAADTGASEFLDMSIVEMARRDGRWVDFGTSMDPEKGGLKYGLHAVKEDCGARMVLCETYEWIL